MDLRKRQIPGEKNENKQECFLKRRQGLEKHAFNFPGPTVFLNNDVKSSP